MLTDIKYSKEGARNYLILPCGKEMEQDFRVKMLERNRLHHFLPCKLCHMNGLVFLYYDISSKVSLHNYRNGKSWNGKEVKRLADALVEAQNELEKYLLDYNGLVLNSEVIYYDYESDHYCFLYYPREERSSNVYGEMFEYLIDNLDVADETVTNIMYELFEEAEQGVLSIKRLQKKLEDSSADLQESSAALEASKTESRLADMQANEAHRAVIDYGEEAVQNRNFNAMSVGELDEHYDSGKGKSKCRRKSRSSLIVYTLVVFFAVLGEIGVAATYFLLNCNQKEQIILISVALVLFFLFCFGISLCIKEQAFQKRKEQYNAALVDYREQDYLSVPQPTLQNVTMEDFLYRGKKEQEQEKQGDETVFFASENTYEYKLFALDKKNKVHVSLQNLPCTIGKARGMVNYCIEDSSVSRMHARVECRNGHYILTDLNSTNGTYVNGMPLDPNEQIEIEPGDEIRFGNMKYCFR